MLFCNAVVPMVQALLVAAASQRTAWEAPGKQRLLSVLASGRRGPVIPLEAETFTQRHSDRSRDTALRAAARRLRERVADLSAMAAGTGPDRALAPRALVDAEALCELAEKAIGVAVDPQPWKAGRKHR